MGRYNAQNVWTIHMARSPVDSTKFLGDKLWRPWSSSCFVWKCKCLNWQWYAPGSHGVALIPSHLFIQHYSLLLLGQRSKVSNTDSRDKPALTVHDFCLNFATQRGGITVQSSPFPRFCKQVIMSYRFGIHVMCESTGVIVYTKSIWATVKLRRNQFSRDRINMIPSMHGTL